MMASECDHKTCEGCKCGCHWTEGPNRLDYETLRRLVFSLYDRRDQQEQQLAQARDMFERLLLWVEKGRFGSMENQFLQLHWREEIRAFLAQKEPNDGRTA